MKKNEIIKLIKTIDSKIKKGMNKSRISQLKQIKKELLNRYSSLGETFVNTDDEKTKALDKVLDIDRKLARGEIKKCFDNTWKKQTNKKLQKPGQKLWLS